MRPHRRQPTRLPCPRDSPGKNTGVGCHFLLQERLSSGHKHLPSQFPGTFVHPPLVDTSHAWGLPAEKHLLAPSCLQEEIQTRQLGTRGPRWRFPDGLPGSSPSHSRSARQPQQELLLLRGSLTWFCPHPPVSLQTFPHSSFKTHLKYHLLHGESGPPSE